MLVALSVISVEKTFVHSQKTLRLSSLVLAIRNINSVFQDWRERRRRRRSIDGHIVFGWCYINATPAAKAKHMGSIWENTCLVRNCLRFWLSFWEEFFVRRLQIFPFFKFIKKNQKFRLERNKLWEKASHATSAAVLATRCQLSDADLALTLNVSLFSYLIAWNWIFLLSHRVQGRFWFLIVIGRLLKNLLIKLITEFHYYENISKLFFCFFVRHKQNFML